MTTPAHFNPRPLRGGRPVGGRGGFDEHGISILVFREEGDAPHQPFDKAHTVISILAFREEGDAEAMLFQKVKSISIPAFREEGDHTLKFPIIHKFLISIPAFREEGDLASFFIRPMTLSFQSPPSVRTATSPPLPSATGEEDFNPRLP